MCGIAGIFEFDVDSSPSKLKNIISVMIDKLHHRGPDGSGVWLEKEGGVGLGHRRLSIVDVSDLGSQPMSSDCGKFLISYNGEIYNSLELRAELQALGRKFFGHSDTEVIVNGFAEWGVKNTVSKIIGIFAIAAWDRSEKTLFLIRDRVGVKPLYWSCVEKKHIIFGSELKSIQASGLCSKKISAQAMASFLRFSYVPSPYTIYETVQKLEAGCILSIDSKSREPKITRYWDAISVANSGQSNIFSSSDEDIHNQLDYLLSDAVERQMIADVPLGAFLSGGIDSSLIVALMQKQSKRPVQTFTIGFDDAKYNEAEHARAISKYLGTEHTELYVTSEMAQNVIPKLTSIYDEPFSDSSQIPTFLISELTQKTVKVALSGDGGDELFAGYNRYLWGSKIHSFSSIVPLSIRRCIANLLLTPSIDFWDKVLSPLSGNQLPYMMGDKIQKAAPLLTMDSWQEIYSSTVSQMIDVAPNIQECHLESWEQVTKTKGLDFVHKMQLADILTYMSDDILTKVDRASMANSLEVRVPMLDHRLVEFSWRMPKHLRFKNGKTKAPLRTVLSRYIPEVLTERPKAGFAIPIGS